MGTSARTESKRSPLLRMNPQSTARYIPDVCTALPILSGEHKGKKILRAMVHQLTGLYPSAAILADADSSWNGEENRFQKILRLCEVTIDSQGTLPTEGPALVVANHPTGPMDGIVLAAWLTQQRHDVRILTTEALAEIPTLRDIVIPLKLYEGKNIESSNAQSLRKAMIHLRRGGILAAFPAGTIAVPDDLHAPSIEQPWKAAVFALAIRCQTPVVCLHIKQQHRPLVVRLLRTHAWVRTLAMGWLFLLMRKKIFGVVVKQTIAVDGAGEAMDLCHSAHRAIDER